MDNEGIINIYFFLYFKFDCHKDKMFSVLSKNAERTHTIKVKMGFLLHMITHSFHSDSVMNIFYFIHRYHHCTCTLAKYMKGFSIGGDEASFNLLSKMLTIDPKKRINLNEAICHSFFTNPSPSLNVFSCLEKIPFPFRKYLSKKIEPVKFEQRKPIIRQAHLQ